MADDFIATVPPGKVINKAEVIAQVTSPDLEMESLVNDDIHVRVYGDVAVVTARGVARGRYKGRDASGQFRYTRVWIKQKGAVAGNRGAINHDRRAVIPNRTKYKKPARILPINDGVIDSE